MMTPRNAPAVAIIVRTKDRAPFLKRALLDISDQTYKDYLVVVVNDGGDAKEASKIVDSFSKKLGGRVTLINNSKSLGKWHAANDGIKNSTSTFVVLHDDDDTWEPQFLEETVAYLQVHEGRYIGVATFSNELFEQEKNGEFVQTSRRQFAPDFEHVSIHGLCRQNMFPPISYLYRRTLHDEIGYYNESLFALADWEFNLRTIEKFDIGMLQKQLANWHIRESDSQYANVTAPDNYQYQENINLLINSLLRKDLEGGKLGIGYLADQLYHGREHEDQMKQLFDHRLNEYASRIAQQVNDTNAGTSERLSELSLAVNTLFSKRLTRKLKRSANWLRGLPGTTNEVDAEHKMRIYSHRLIKKQLNPRLIFGKASAKNVPVIICMWERTERTSAILKNLDKQRSVPGIDVYFWDNSLRNRNVAELAEQFKPTGAVKSISVFESELNVGGMGRFYLARSLYKYKGSGRVIMLDDDEDIDANFVSDLLKNYRPHTYSSTYAFRLLGGYWKRADLTNGEAADYCGTGGSIIDASIFAENELFENLPYEYWYIEDLWLSYFLKARGWKLEKVDAAVNFVDHDNNLYHGLVDKKEEFYQFLVKGQSPES
jgi:glycosyltransferase involved in cell wall biosynthesis